MKKNLALALLLQVSPLFAQGFVGAIKYQTLITSSIDLKPVFDARIFNKKIMVKAFRINVGCYRDNKIALFNFQVDQEKFAPSYECASKKPIIIKIKPKAFSEIKIISLSTSTTLNHDVTELLYDFTFAGPISGENYKKELDPLEKLIMTGFDVPGNEPEADAWIKRLQSAKELLQYPTTRTLKILEQAMNFKGSNRDSDLSQFIKENYPGVLKQMQIRYSEEELAQAMLEVLEEGNHQEEPVEMMYALVKNFKTGAGFWFSFKYGGELFQEMLKRPDLDQWVKKYKDQIMSDVFSEFNEGFETKENACEALTYAPQKDTFAALLSTSMKDRYDSVRTKCATAVTALSVLTDAQELRLYKKQFDEILSAEGSIFGFPVILHNGALIELAIASLGKIRDTESVAILKKALTNHLLKEGYKQEIRKILGLKL